MPAEVVILRNQHSYRLGEEMVENANTESDLPSDFITHFNGVVESEFKIAKYIRSHKDCLVMIENSPYLDMSFTNMRMFAEEAREVFPTGLPTSESMLNFSQKRFLYLFNGGVYSVLSGHIKRTYDDDLTYLENQDEIKRSARGNSWQEKISAESKISQTREYLTLKKAIDLSEKTGKKVLIVYGYAHTFTDVASCFPSLNLSFIDTLEKKPAVSVAQLEFDRAMIRLRPPVNCERLRLGFFDKSGDQLYLSSGVTQQAQANYAAAVFAIGSLLLLGIGCCLLMFKCCSRGKRKEALEVVSQLKKNR